MTIAFARVCKRRRDALNTETLMRSYVLGRSSACQRSSAFWYEAGAAGINYIVEPLSGLDCVDFIECILRNDGDVEVFPRTSCRFRGSQQSRAPLYRPCQQYLRRRLPKSRSNGQNRRVFERARPHPVTQRGERQKHDALLLAEV